MTSNISLDTETRVAVIELRRRLELLAAGAFSASFPDHEIEHKQDKIKDRLAYLVVAYQGKASTSELIGLVRLSRYIYTRSSDVLHGRASAVNFPPVLIDEWQVIVDRLDQLRN